MTNQSRPLPEFVLSAEMRHGRRVFEVVLRSSVELMQTKGIPPSAVISGLLGVVTEIGAATCGRREIRRVLMQAADACTDDQETH